MPIALMKKINKLPDTQQDMIFQSGSILAFRGLDGNHHVIATLDIEVYKGRSYLLMVPVMYYEPELPNLELILNSKVPIHKVGMPHDQIVEHYPTMQQIWRLTRQQNQDYYLALGLLAIAFRTIRRSYKQFIPLGRIDWAFDDAGSITSLKSLEEFYHWFTPEESPSQSTNAQSIMLRLLLKDPLIGLSESGNQDVLKQALLSLE